MDFDISACRSYRVNRPAASVFRSDVSAFLATAARLRFLRSWAQTAPSGGAGRFNVLNVTMREGAAGSVSPPLQGDQPVESMIVTLKRADGSLARLRDRFWEPEEAEAIGSFVAARVGPDSFPLPGDIHVIAGGPPCQGLSGMNRQRVKSDKPEDALQDRRNVCTLHFLQAIQLYRPRYFAMEQVELLVWHWWHALKEEGNEDWSGFLHMFHRFRHCGPKRIFGGGFLIG